MQLLIIKRRRAEAGAPHAPIPNGGDVGMPKADEFTVLGLSEITVLMSATAPWAGWHPAERPPQMLYA